MILSRLALVAAVLASSSAGSVAAADESSSGGSSLRGKKIERDFLDAVLARSDDSSDARRLQEMAGCSCTKFSPCSGRDKENIQFTFLQNNLQALKDAESLLVQEYDTLLKASIKEGETSKEEILRKQEQMNKRIVENMACIKVDRSVSEPFDDRMTNLEKRLGSEEFQRYLPYKFQLDAMELIEWDRLTHQQKIDKGFTKKIIIQEKEVIEVNEKFKGVIGCGQDKLGCEKETQVVENYNQQLNVKYQTDKLAVMVTINEQDSTIDVTGTKEEILRKLVGPKIDGDSLSGLCPCGCVGFTDNQGIAYDCACLSSCKDATDLAQPDASCKAKVGGGNKCDESMDNCCCAPASSPFTSVCTETCSWTINGDCSNSNPP